MGMRFPFLVCALLLGMLTVCGDSVSQERVPPMAAADDVPKPVNKDGRWGYVNTTGQFVIQPKYFAAEPFSEGLALVATRKPSQPFGNEYGEFRLAQITYIDRSGHEILAPLSVRRARSFADGRALVVPDSMLRITGGCAKGMGGKWGYIDKDGQTIIPFRFLWAGTFHDGQACVSEKRGADEVTDRRGNIIPDKKCR